VELRQARISNDDLGYGFDNIAAVLTISPVLMERYLTAADISRPARSARTRCR